MKTETLQEAIKTNDKAFNLLKWLEDALKKGFISIGYASSLITNPEVAKKWISEHYDSFPLEAKPENRGDTAAFVNIFSSFGLTSFIINKNRGTRYVPHLIRGNGAAYIENNYIVPVTLTKKDKIKAQNDKLDILLLLAEELECDDFDLFESYIEDKQVAKSTSIYAYCELLVKRMNGIHSGRSHLVLWREFAWTQGGSPVKNFDLSEKIYFDAKASIIENLKKST